MELRFWYNRRTPVMKKIKKGWWIFISLIITILLFLLSPKTVAHNVEVETITSSVTVVAPPEKQIVPIKTKELPQILLDIAWAESHDDQKKVGNNYRYKKVTNEDGTITKVKYLWSQDIGRFQINDFYNKESCKKAGFDIYTVEGNTGCALKMYNEQGTTPWNASKYCWSDIQACKEKRGGAYYQ